MVALWASVVAVAAVAMPEASVVVLVSGRQGVDKASANNLAEAVSAALARAGWAQATSPQAAAARLQLAGVDPASCEGRADCLGVMGQSFAPAIVVGVQVGRLGKRFAVQLTAVPAGAAVIVAEHSFILPTPTLDRPNVVEAVTRVADQLRARQTQPTTPKSSGKPPEVATTTGASPSPTPLLAPTGAPPGLPAAGAATVGSPPSPSATAVGDKTTAERASPVSPRVTSALGPDLPLREPAAEPLRVAGGGHLEAELIAAPTTPAMTVVVAKEVPTATPWRRYVGMALGVLALGAAGVGAYEGLGAMSDGDVLRAGGGATPEDWGRVSGRAVRADVAWGATAVLAAGGAILLILSPAGSSPTPSSSPGAGAATGGGE